MYVGQEQSFKVEIDRSKVEKFLEISEDINPLHNDPAYAKSKGFEDRVVYGMLTSSFYSTLIGVYLPGKYAMLHSLNIQFSKPVYIGDKLKVHGKIRYINEAYKQIEIAAYISNQDGIKVSKAIIKTGVMDE